MAAVQSEIIPHLQIVSPEIYEKAQEIARERSSDYEERRIPMNTKGNALLSGNVFCGHCNARLTLTTNGKKYQRKDGNVTVTPKTRYVCYNKTRHPEKCDGQTGYTTSKLDGVVEKIVKSIFSRIKEKPGEQINVSDSFLLTQLLRECSASGGSFIKRRDLHHKNETFSASEKP